MEPRPSPSPCLSTVSGDSWYLRSFYRHPGYFFRWSHRRPCRLRLTDLPRSLSSGRARTSGGSRLSGTPRSHEVPVPRSQSRSTVEPGIPDESTFMSRRSLDDQFVGFRERGIQVLPGSPLDSRAGSYDPVDLWRRSGVYGVNNLPPQSVLVET